MKDIHCAHIAKRLSKFICDANAEVMRFTRIGDIQRTGCEGFVSGYIASRMVSENLLIGDVYCEYAALESRVKDLVSEELEGESSREKGRFDVVAFDDKDKPLMIVEVKRHFGWSTMSKDVRRLKRALDEQGASRGGTLRAGAVVGVQTHWELGTRKASASELVEAFEQHIWEDYDVGTWGEFYEEEIALSKARGSETRSHPKSITGFAVVIKG